MAVQTNCLLDNYSLSLFELFSTLVLSNCWDAWSNNESRSGSIYSYLEANTSANAVQFNVDLDLSLFIIESNLSWLVDFTSPSSKVHSPLAIMCWVNWHSHKFLPSYWKLQSMGWEGSNSFINEGLTIVSFVYSSTYFTSLCLSD